MILITLLYALNKLTQQADVITHALDDLGVDSDLFHRKLEVGPQKDTSTVTLDPISPQDVMNQYKATTEEEAAEILEKQCKIVETSLAPKVEEWYNKINPVTIPAKTKDSSGKKISSRNKEAKMPISQQVLKSISITKLKNLRNVEINFQGSPLVAIMGVNGVGKSTILHALACCYKPNENPRKDYKFSEFFLPNTYALWDDSKFSITYSYRDGARFTENAEKVYQKEKRWTPKYDQRPERYCSYFGIKTCIPDIESDNTKSFVHLTMDQQDDDASKAILEDCKYVLDIPYQELDICKRKSGKEYLGVKRDSIGYCTSFSMGAGEQRIFKIFSEIRRCPTYALILIDEIDLLLHENALKRLIQRLYQIGTARHLQVIFTTHSMLMSELEEYVQIRYLTQTKVSTLLQTSISTDSIFDLSGNSQRPIQIYVEDKLSEMIIHKVAEELNSQRYVKTFRFGAAQNSFTLLAGKALNDELNDKTIAVLDGDVYKTTEEKKKHIQKVITGQSQDMEKKRKAVLDAVKEYCLPDGQAPEKFIHKSILSLSNDVLRENDEIRIALESIENVTDTHQYLNSAIQRLGLEYSIGLSRMIDWFAKSEDWDNFVFPIHNWLEAQLKNL